MHTIILFIEFMDVGATNGWRMDDVINREYPVQAIEPGYRGQVAQRRAFADGGGGIGVIASVTQAFCADCSRIRLSTNGKLYTCLLATHGVDLGDSLRRQDSDETLTGLIENTWALRNDRYSQFRRGATPPPERKIEMPYIGG